MNLNKKKKVTILGKALSSTIATMDSLGPIGQEVLKEFGILRIDESKSYPIEIRNAIHKAVLDKYGPIALIDMGFKFGELAHEVLIKPVVELSKKEENIIIIISDDGPGIPKEKYEDVFKPFFTLDPSRNNLKGESGLGMTIARDIIRSHGGDIKLSRSNLGGLKTIINLPA